MSTKKEPKKPFAKTEKEWWEMMRRATNNWNNNAHEEDNISLLDLVSMYTDQEIFGYKVEKADFTESGFSITKS